MQYNHTHDDIQHHQAHVDVPPEEVAGGGPSMALVLAIVASVVLVIALMAWSPWDSGAPDRIPDGNQPGQQAPSQPQSPLRDQPSVPRQ